MKNTVIFSFIILGYVVVANILSNSIFGRIDLTQNKIYSISSVSKNKLRNLDDLVTLELYFSDNLPQNMKKVQKDIKDITDEFRIFAGRHLRVVWKDPIKRQTDREDAFALGIPAVRVQTIERDKVQMVDGYMGIAIRYAGKSEVIPLVRTTDNFEYEIIQRIIRLSATQLPTVAVIKTDTLPYIDPRLADFYAIEIPEDNTHKQYAAIFQALIPGYNLRYIDLGRESEIDPAIVTIIIPGEDEASYFTNPHATDAIDQYLMRGGNVIVLAQRFAIDLQKSQNATVSNSLLYEMLEKWGINVPAEMLIDASCGQIIVPQQVGQFMMNVPMDYPFMVRVAEDGFNRNISPLASMTNMVFPWATPVFVSENIDPDIIADTLIMSSEYSTTFTPPFRIDPNQNWEFFFERAFGAETLKRYPIAVRLWGSDSRGQVIVIGNAGFATREAGGMANMPMLQNLVDWISLDDNLISIRSRNMIDRTLVNRTMKSDGDNDGFIYKIFNIASMPLVLIIMGLAIFFHRRRQQYGHL